MLATLILTLALVGAPGDGFDHAELERMHRLQPTTVDIVPTGVDGSPPPAVSPRQPAEAPETVTITNPSDDDYEALVGTSPVIPADHPSLLERTLSGPAEVFDRAGVTPDPPTCPGSVEYQVACPAGPVVTYDEDGRPSHTGITSLDGVPTEIAPNGQIILLDPTGTYPIGMLGEGQTDIVPEDELLREAEQTAGEGLTVIGDDGTYGVRVDR